MNHLTAHIFQRDFIHYLLILTNHELGRARIAISMSLEELGNTGLHGHVAGGNEPDHCLLALELNALMIYLYMFMY